MARDRFALGGHSNEFVLFERPKGFASSGVVPLHGGYLPVFKIIVARAVHERLPWSGQNGKRGNAGIVDAQ